MFTEERSPARRQLNPDKAFGGLNSRQAQFAEAVFSGLSNVEAYRRVYQPTNENENTVYQNAANVAQNPLVIAKLNEMQAKREERSSLVHSFNKEFVINGIIGLALKADKDSTRLAAFIALGKTADLDLFRDHKVIDKPNRTPADVDEALRTELRRMMTDAKIIEGEANAPTSPAAARSVSPTPTNDPPRDRRRKPKPA